MAFIKGVFCSQALLAHGFRPTHDSDFVRSRNQPAQRLLILVIILMITTITAIVIIITTVTLTIVVIVTILNIQTH